MLAWRLTMPVTESKGRWDPPNLPTSRTPSRWSAPSCWTAPLP